ncbi:MAG: hypothetical protein K8I27_04085 [Planctomycetes bacterium]|nr:hypothetical protein [Planctomycetota bacterium]
MSGFVVWWMDRPWWSRWLICLIPAAICLIDYIATGSFFVWLGGAALAMIVVNLVLSMREVLDVVMPRRDRDD